MKIIGKINSEKYLVEITISEIIHAAGYSTHYDKEWEKHAPYVRGSYGNISKESGLIIGSEIKVNAAYDFHNRLSEHQDKARSSAAFLRGLADMIDGAMPDVLIPPPTQVKPETVVVDHLKAEGTNS